LIVMTWQAEPCSESGLGTPSQSASGLPQTTPGPLALAGGLQVRCHHGQAWIMMKA
jgi:hypothetical protein